MIFNIKQDGLVFMISSDNKLCFQINANKVSDKIKIKYDYLMTDNAIRFTYPFDESWTPRIDRCTYLSERKDVKAVEISKDSISKVIASLGASSVIYTGAGLSRGADIMTCDELYELLYINEDFDYMVEAFINKADYILAQFKMFSMRLMHSKPTKAHFKIAELIKEKNCKLISENLDNLHLKTGVHAIYANENVEELMDIKPDKVLLIGVGKPMCSLLFDKWHEQGALFYAINRTYTEMNIPTSIYVGDVQGVFCYED